MDREGAPEDASTAPFPDGRVPAGAARAGAVGSGPARPSRALCGGTAGSVAGRCLHGDAAAEVARCDSVRGAARPRERPPDRLLGQPALAGVHRKQLAVTLGTPRGGVQSVATLERAEIG